MRAKYILLHSIYSIIFVAIFSCSDDELSQKGFAVSASDLGSSEESNIALIEDSIGFRMQPGDILLTADSRFRLTPMYKVNYNSKKKSVFLGSNRFHTNYNNYTRDNNWHYHLIPGFVSAYGYNLVNLSIHNVKTDSNYPLFEKPVLIRTIYFPSLVIDTLNSKPVERGYLFISVYNEDSNKDGFINTLDLRRFQLFDKDGSNPRTIIPEEYSVFKSKYDPANDYLYVYARLDENNNGTTEMLEPVHIFWIDLKNPDLTGRQF